MNMLQRSAERELALGIENQALRDSADNVLCQEVDRWNEGLTALETYLVSGLADGHAEVKADTLLSWLMDLYGYAHSGTRPEWLDPALQEMEGA